MNYEVELSKSIDLLVNEDHNGFETKINQIVSSIKSDLKNDSINAQVFFWWGTALEIQEDYDQALLKYEASLKINPEHLDSWLALARILLDHHEKDEETLQLLNDKIIPLQPDNDIALELKDRCLVSLGQRVTKNQ